MTKTSTFRLTKDRFEHKAGTLITPYAGYDYGLSADDERYTGVQHESMVVVGTTGPFFTVPVTDFEEA